jgi:hypothetical protein
MYACHRTTDAAGGIDRIVLLDACQSFLVCMVTTTSVMVAHAEVSSPSEQITSCSIGCPWSRLLPFADVVGNWIRSLAKKNLYSKRNHFGYPGIFLPKARRLVEPGAPIHPGMNANHRRLTPASRTRPGSTAPAPPSSTRRPAPTVAAPDTPATGPAPACSAAGSSRA